MENYRISLSSSRIMYCTQCGTLRVEGGKFCTSCGTQFDEVVNNQPEQEITEEIQEIESLEKTDSSSSESASILTEDSRDEEESTETQFSEDVGAEGNQAITQSEDTFEEFGIFETQSSETGVENETKEVGNRSKRELLRLVLTPILVLGVAFLIASSTLIQPGTISLLDHYRDADGDGVSDADDLCVTGLSGWESTDYSDYDSDGCKDAIEDDDDDEDGVVDNKDNCAKGHVGWSSSSSSDYDSDGCKDATEDYDDDDDGVVDSLDDCLRSPLNRVDFDGDGCTDSEDSDDDNDGVLDIIDDCRTGLQYGLDKDGDGCMDSEDTDDDGDGILDTYDDCPTGLEYGTDTDGDGCKDSEDSDDDGDGFWDWNDDFPLDESEWLDSDDDGIGDNSDNDDDNDGVIDSIDVNDFEDTGILINLYSFAPIEQMDWFDDYAEIYICLYLEGELFACNPDTGYWSMNTGSTYSLDHEFFVDLPEDTRYHTLQLAAWDSDSWEDDLMDINPSSDWNSYVFTYDSVLGTIDKPWTAFGFVASGEGDGQGWDGVLTFGVESVDLTKQRFSTFYWVFNSQTYELSLNLDYDTYSYFKNLDHSVDYYDISTYARFSTPDEDYIVNLADTLETMAIANGYTSDIEKAEFVHAFVGAIQYEYDIDGMGQNEYPKYPIEMLWHASGDCEDAAAMYISIVEAMGFDAILVIGQTKRNAEEEFGGHAWAIIHIPDHSGYGWTNSAGMKYYFVETTAWKDDGYWGVGVNPWYEIEDTSQLQFYDVE